MHVAFLYNEFAEDPASGTEPELPVDFPVVDALRRLGHDVTLIAATLDLAEVRRRLEQIRPDVAFNRVESLGGSDRMMAAVTLLLDAMGLPFTGCPTGALVATASKLATKERLRAAGLPTPNWIAGDGLLPLPLGEGQGEGNLRSTGPYPHPLPKGEGTVRVRPFILKSVFEHASFKMDDQSVLTAEEDDVRARVAECEARWGRPYFAEQYVDGREFNLSLLGGGPQVLPPAEIDFSAFPAGKPRIVGHQAKFDAKSFEYDHTPRQFDFPPADRPLVKRLRELAVACWHLFGLQGYARVDFRCDRQGRPWILEINANPCLGSASGFAAALEEAGIGYDGGIERIVADAVARSAPPGTVLGRESFSTEGRDVLAKLPVEKDSRPAQ